MFKNLSIYTRLVILVLVLTASFLISTFIGWAGFQSAKKGLNHVYEGSVEEIFQLFTIRKFYNINFVDTIEKIRDGSETWKRGEALIKEAISGLDSTLTNYLKAIKNDFQDTITRPEDQKLIEDLERRVVDSKSQLIKVEEIMRRQDLEALNAFAKQDMYAIVDPIRANVDNLINWHIRDTENDYQEALTLLARSQDWMIIVFILALALSIATALLITRSILQPLKLAAEAMRKISLGEVEEVNIPDQGQTADEIGIFLNNLQLMVAYKKGIIEGLKEFAVGNLNFHADLRSNKDTLSKSINQVVDSSKKMSEVLSTIANGDLTVSIQPRSDQDILGLAIIRLTKTLKQILGNIQSDVLSLANSSQEITTSISEVATGSSETAASVAETTTTVEELKQTAQISAEKAKDVLTSSEDTLQVVKDSEKSLKNTIEDMNEISEKMHLISEGIIKLSELSQTIGEIIDTVNDLAEQSNLLAVNAAIEAAKAGEQGKGFGVVAQEIRTLAEQSKAATVQVRSILNDIQNATSTAVLATEQGSKAVDKGVNQSIQTNESMRTLVASIAHVTQAANQIAISSQQQLIGVDQVTVAMNSINEASSQQVDNMKRIENAIFALDSIGKTLRQIVSQFHLNELQGSQQDRSLQFDPHQQEAISSRSKFSPSNSG